MASFNISRSIIIFVKFLEALAIGIAIILDLLNQLKDPCSTNNGTFTLRLVDSKFCFAPLAATVTIEYHA